MKILVTGSEGQLGRSIQKLSGNFTDYSFTFIDIFDLDLTDSAGVQSFIDRSRPDCIINCAAYTAVDKAESEVEQARAVNAIVPENLAKICSEEKIRLVHISTDYVFDGNHYRPYSEEDAVNPVSVYARSKHAGETGILKHKAEGIIIRTSWLYSEYGKNFVKTILAKGKEFGILRVVYDQVGGPTYAGDLAAAIFKILPQAFKGKKTEIYHYADEGVISWYDFARAILEIAGIRCTVLPIESKDFPVPAVRPSYSVFNKTKIKTAFGLEIPYWRESLEHCIRNIQMEEKKNII